MNERTVMGRVQFEALPGLWVEQGENKRDGSKTYDVSDRNYRWLGWCNQHGKAQSMGTPDRGDEADVVAAVQAFREAANTPPAGQPMPTVVWLHGGP